jgi:hypothetical protein
VNGGFVATVAIGGYRMSKVMCFDLASISRFKSVATIRANAPARQAIAHFVDEEKLLVFKSKRNTYSSGSV